MQAAVGKCHTALSPVMRSKCVLDSELAEELILFITGPATSVSPLKTQLWSYLDSVQRDTWIWRRECVTYGGCIEGAREHLQCHVTGDRSVLQVREIKRVDEQMRK